MKSITELLLNIPIKAISLLFLISCNYQDAIETENMPMEQKIENLSLDGYHENKREWTLDAKEAVKFSGDRYRLTLPVFHLFSDVQVLKLTSPLGGFNSVHLMLYPPVQMAAKDLQIRLEKTVWNKESGQIVSEKAEIVGSQFQLSGRDLQIQAPYQHLKMKAVKLMFEYE